MECRGDHGGANADGHACLLPERHFGDPIEDGRVDFRNVYPVIGVDFAVDRVGGCPRVSHVVALSSADFRACYVQMFRLCYVRVLNAAALLVWLASLASGRFAVTAPA